MLIWNPHIISHNIYVAYICFIRINTDERLFVWKYKYKYLLSYNIWPTHTSRCIVIWSVLYCWTIIQQCMLVVDKFHVKMRYTYTHFLHMFFKSFVGSELNKLFECKKKRNTFGIRNTQYSIALSVHKQLTKSIQYNIRYTKSCELPNY